MFEKLGNFFNKMMKPEVKELTSKDAAKKYYDDTKDDASADEVVKHSGKIVYGGTETAVKDFD